MKKFLKEYISTLIPVTFGAFITIGIFYGANYILNKTHTANATQPSIDTVYVHDTIFLEHP